MQGFLDALKSFQQFFLHNWKTFIVFFVDFMVYMKIIGMLDILRASKIMRKYTYEDTLTWFCLTEPEKEEEEKE